MKSCVIFIEDGLTGKTLITIDLDVINDFDVISEIIKEITYNNHLGEKHNIYIRYGFKP